MLRSSGVLWFAFCVESSFVTDADGVAVVVFDMCSDHGFRSARFDATVSADDVVIADAVRIASCSVPLVNLLSRAGLVGFDCAAMDDDEGDNTIHD